MGKRIVIFDLDGTLLDTLGDLAVAVNYALEKHGYAGHEISSYRYFVGNGADKLIERALPKEFVSEPVRKSIKRTFVDYYLSHKEVLTHPYAGIFDLLKEIEARNIKLAVASNKFQQATIELVNIYFGKARFASVMGQVEHRPVKPDPSIVQDILTETGLQANDTLYVGDSGVDMLTAQRCGVDSVGVTWGFRPQEELEENGAKHLAHLPEQILQWV